MRKGTPMADKIGSATDPLCYASFGHIALTGLGVIFNRRLIYNQVPFVVVMCEA
jgi:hypothetical protein